MELGPWRTRGPFFLLVFASRNEGLRFELQCHPPLGAFVGIVADSFADQNCAKSLVELVCEGEFLIAPDFHPRTALFERLFDRCSKQRGTKPQVSSLGKNIKTFERTFGAADAHLALDLCNNAWPSGKSGKEL